MEGQALPKNTIIICHVTCHISVTHCAFVLVVNVDQVTWDYSSALGPSWLPYHARCRPFHLFFRDRLEK